MNKKEKILVSVGVLGAAALDVIMHMKLKKQWNESRKFNDKILMYYHMLNKWLELHQKGDTLIPYFLENQYKSVAIYGYKELGERLYDELKHSEIEVKYIIDNEADSIYADVDICTPERALQDVDVVVVTASFYFDEIEKMMKEKLDCPIVSIEDVIYWCS